MMKKKTYITPILYSRKITINHLLQATVPADPETGGNTTINAKQGNGFDWGNSVGDDGDEE